MHKRNRWFVTIGLVYGLIGALVALVWLSYPNLIPGNVARIHGHIMLLGFVLNLIYGIALHVLPRFSGQALYSERMANWQLYVANIGLPLMIVGWLSMKNEWISVGGGLQCVAIALFGINILLTVRPSGPWR